MTLKDLLESAHLDALGLLDEVEREAFERALAAAPGAVREQVRAEQARWAMSEALLPMVDPPAGLRERVLQAVSSAMSEGVPREVQDDDAGLGYAGLGYSAPAIPGRRRVSAMWRVASVALLCAVAVLGGAFGFVYQSNARLMSQLSSGQAVDAFVGAFGPQHELLRGTLFGEGTVRVAFAPSEGVSGRAALFLVENSDVCRLFCENLPQRDGVSYHLVRLDEDGRVAQSLAEFRGANGLFAQEVRGRLTTGMQLAIVSTVRGQAPADGIVLMTATVNLAA